FGNSLTERTTKGVVLDGNNHLIIDLQPAVSPQNEFSTGFFGSLLGEVKNIGFVNAKVEGGNALNVGILAGKIGVEGNDTPSKVTDSYFVGTVDAAGNAGGITGTIDGTTTINNTYTNVALTKEGEETTAIGGIAGITYAPLTLQHSYAAGSGTSDVVGYQESPATISDAFAWDTAKQDELCQKVASWDGWAKDGKVGNGYPLLQWQVARGDYKTYCGFYDGTAIGTVSENLAAAFSADEFVTVTDAAGRTVYTGRMDGMNLRRGLFLIKGDKRAMKVMLK
ncbi:MAG: hypothetical protein HUK03_09695, partial [Bacteroidaceae bacterium]|nr:hypothetical protein [Bacteroidaceae bacterium]